MGRSSRTMANVLAGTLGAVAAIGVVGAVAVFGGVTLQQPATGTAPQPAAAGTAVAASPIPAAVPAAKSATTAAQPAVAALAPATHAVSVAERFGSAPETSARYDWNEDPAGAGLPIPKPLAATVPHRHSGTPASHDALALDAADDEASLPPQPDGADGALAYAPVPAPRPDLPRTSGSAETPSAATDGQLRTVGGRGVNVRSGPGMSHGTLFALASGAQVRVSGKPDHGWLHVTAGDGRDGWIYGDFLAGQ